MKDPLGEFATDDVIDTLQDYTVFAVLWVSFRVPKFGSQLFIEAWNHHSIPPVGRPIGFMAQNNRTIPVDQLMIKQSAAEHYRRVSMRQLISMSVFGVDLLVVYTNFEIGRETKFSWKFSFKGTFSKIQQENILKFRFSFQFFLWESFVLLQT